VRGIGGYVRPAPPAVPSTDIGTERANRPRPVRARPRGTRRPRHGRRPAGATAIAQGATATPAGARHHGRAVTPRVLRAASLSATVGACNAVGRVGVGPASPGGTPARLSGGWSTKRVTGNRPPGRGARRAGRRYPAPADAEQAATVRHWRGQRSMC